MITWKDVAVGIGALLGAAQASRLRVSGKYRNLYEQYGNQYGVDPNILHAIALQETREQPALISPPNRNGTRDRGLMQINDTNLSRLGLNETSALLPGPNVEAAAKLIREIQRGGINGLLDIFSVYNAGISAHDADPMTPGFQPRAKLDTAGTAYFNDKYVVGAFGWYVLVVLGAFAPLKTSTWS
jgi:soluble lytic murein transglycosylase-like protein